MNEIITRLNEIEEKAGELLCNAKADKEQLAGKLEQQKRTLDAKYQRMEAESAKQLREQLMADAQAQIEVMQQRNAEAGAQLEARYEAQREQLAEEILRRVITVDGQR